MGRAIAFKLAKLIEGDQGHRKKKSARGRNRQEQKLKKEVKKLHQIVEKTKNKLYRRGQWRKATKKEKEIIKEFRVLIEKDTTNYYLRNAREHWLDKLRYRNIKLAKCEERRRRNQNRIMFQLDQKGLFRTVEGEKSHEGEIPEIEKFVEFCGGIWEREERIANMTWMKEILRHLNEKVNQINEFNITFKKVKKEVTKRKR